MEVDFGTLELPAVYAKLRVWWWSVTGVGAARGEGRGGGNGGGAGGGIERGGGRAAAPSPNYALGAFALANALLQPEAMRGFRAAIAGVTGARVDAVLASAISIAATGEVWALEAGDPVNAGALNVSMDDLVDQVMGGAAALAGERRLLAGGGGGGGAALGDGPPSRRRQRRLDLALLRPAPGAAVAGSPLVEITLLTLCATKAEAENRSAALARAGGADGGASLDAARTALADALNAPPATLNTSIDTDALRVVSLSYKRSRFAALLDFLRRNIVGVVLAGVLLSLLLLLLAAYRSRLKQAVQRRRRLARLDSAAVAPAPRAAEKRLPGEWKDRSRLAALEAQLLQNSGDAWKAGDGAADGGSDGSSPRRRSASSSSRDSLHSEAFQHPSEASVAPRVKRRGRVPMSVAPLGARAKLPPLRASAPLRFSDDGAPAGADAANASVAHAAAAAAAAARSIAHANAALVARGDVPPGASALAPAGGPSRQLPRRNALAAAPGGAHAKEGGRGWLPPLARRPRGSRASSSGGSSPERTEADEATSSALPGSGAGAFWDALADDTIRK